ncbi:MAG: chlorophyllide reductase iron protein subunit X, partial [Pseudomonadota bacterium]
MHPGKQDEENTEDMYEALRQEASVQPDPVHKGEVTKETQIIAIYGKGGIGKSFTLANLSYNLA